MKMFREAHAEAFTEERNMKGWQKEGILPKFNRMEYWNLLHEVNQRKQSLGSNQDPCSNTTAPSSNKLPLNNDATGAENTPPSDNPTTSTSRANQVQLLILQAGSTPTEVENEQQHNSAGSITGRSVLPLPSSLQTTVSRAIEQLPSLQTIATLSHEEVLTHYLKAMEVLTKVNDDRTCYDGGYVEDENDDDELMGPSAISDGSSRRNRITAKDIWGLPGSATGPEALEILRAKEADRRRIAEEKYARDEAREQKRRRTIVDNVNKATHLLTTISNSGPSKLNSLVVNDLKALLTHSDPEGKEQKGNKAELLARVKILESVQGALAIYESSKNPNPPASAPSDPVLFFSALGEVENFIPHSEVSTSVVLTSDANLTT
jgi:hypothetical protein